MNTVRATMHSTVHVHMHFVQLDGLHDACDYMICTDICDYTQRNNLFLYVVFECFSECAVKWHGNQKSSLFSSRVWLESMVVCKELSLPCPHNSWLMWKWHGWNLWLAWTCLFKSCMENNGGLFLRHKNYFSGGETRKKETEKQFIRHSYQPAWRYHTEISQHEGLFTLVI